MRLGGAHAPKSASSFSALGFAPRWGRHLMSPIFRLKRVALPLLVLFRMLVSPPAHLLEKARNASSRLIARWRFEPRTDDIFIVTYPKSGTTWLQQIVYQLTGDGNMDIPHIRTVSPYFDVDLMASPDQFRQLPSPRIFKSHGTFNEVYNPKSRFIYVMRHGVDVAHSYYHHYRCYNGFSGAFDVFFRAFVNGRIDGRSWFRHVSEWLSQSGRTNILVLRFEDLRQDLPSQVRRIAEFCQIPLSEALMERVVGQSSLAFMKAHEAQFEWATGGLYAKGMTLNDFIRSGGHGRWRVETLDSRLLESYTRQFERFLRDLNVEHYGRVE